MKKNKNIKIIQELDFIKATKWFVSFLLYEKKAPLEFVSEINEIVDKWEEMRGDK